MPYPGLPVLYSIRDASIYRYTVEQFYPQFFDVEKVVYGEVPFRDYFSTTNPVILGIQLCIAWTILTLSVSVVTGNYSWTDRLWSLVPTSYVTLMVARAYVSSNGNDGRALGLLHARLVLMWVMHVAWSTRLTRNYARKGGYEKGSEDYRWSILRTKMGETFYLAFQLLYIPIQNILVAAISLPSYIVLLIGDEVPLNWKDALAILCLSLEIYGQWSADDTQYRYQSSKTKYAQASKQALVVEEGFSRVELERGFVTAGLWRYSRHPAFFLEQLIWFTFYIWAASTNGDYWNYSVVGVIAYFILFQGSTRLTESITAAKYPEYRKYQAAVGMLAPVPMSRWVEDSR